MARSEVWGGFGRDSLQGSWHTDQPLEEDIGVRGLAAHGADGLATLAAAILRPRAEGVLLEAARNLVGRLTAPGRVPPPA